MSLNRKIAVGVNRKTPFLECSPGWIQLQQCIVFACNSLVPKAESLIKKKEENKKERKKEKSTKMRKKVLKQQTR